MKKINEIFYSIQGEGYFTGTPAVFIRFSGCNLQCDFCDTEHQDGVFMSDEEILSEVQKYPATHLVFTGGEPGLQLTAGLIRDCKQKGRFIQIETNGSILLPEGIDWITCSPKPGKEAVIMRPDELKVVYTGQDMSEYDKFIAKVYCLQPCSCRNTEEVIKYIRHHPKWRLSLQTHKLLGIQ
ncbi:MAG: 7-carboxy-7-deazaguanine synthase QueE [Tannerellaceae bacterium]|nr:7-carboxy-7-deazaguanine synthase QueE [Tannerellaceae bacterium]